MLRPGWRAGRYGTIRFGASYGTWRHGEGGTLVTTKQRMSALGVLLGIVMIVVASHAASLQGGYRWSPVPGTPKYRRCGPWPDVCSGRCKTLGRPSRCWPHPLGARFGPLQRAQRVRSVPLSLGPRSLRVPLRRRGSADPFALPERRDRRHPAARRHHHLGLTANAPRVGISSLVGHILDAPHHAFDVQGSRSRVAPAPDTVTQGPPALPKPSRGYRGQRR
jgi:hypothetical protein